jgi:ribose 5-phosphate isomerase RpiB
MGFTRVPDNFPNSVDAKLVSTDHNHPLEQRHWEYEQLTNKVLQDTCDSNSRRFINVCGSRGVNFAFAKAEPMLCMLCRKEFLDGGKMVG